MMKAKLILIPIFLIGSCVASFNQQTNLETTEHPVTTDGPKFVARVLTNSSYQSCGTNKVCVRYYLCNNGKVDPYGARVIEPRIGALCDNVLETCCDLSEILDEPNLNPLPPTVGCGYRNKNGVGLQNKELADNEAKFGEPAQISEDLIKDVFDTHETETVTESSFTTTENPATTLAPQKSVTVEQTDSSFQICGTRAGTACVRQGLCNNGNIGINLRFNFPIRHSKNSCNNPLETCCDPNDMSDLLKLKPLPLKDKCGYRNKNGVGLQNNELADNEAKFGEFPWMVAILNKIILSGKVLSLYKCGGSLIAPNVVLTAAHCVNVTQAQNFLVRAGEWEPNSDSEPYPHQERRVVKIIVHEEYKNRSLQNDIAILFLETSFDKAPHINTVCLPAAYSNFDMSRCIVSGWGKTNFGTNILKKIDLPVVPKAKCQKHLRKTRLGPSFKLHSSFMCAGGEIGKDTCRGDGGSPLVCPMANNPDRYYQAGIVSWGVECGDENVPGVYASIPKLRSWINKQLAYKEIWHK